MENRIVKVDDFISMLVDNLGCSLFCAIKSDLESFKLLQGFAEGPLLILSRTTAMEGLTCY